MLDIIFAVLALVVVVVLRSEPLRRLRPLTFPLILTAVAALAHAFAQVVIEDQDLSRWTAVALVLAMAFVIARATLLVVFEWVLIRRMGVTPPRLMREVVALLVYLGLAWIILRSMNVEVTGLAITSAVLTVVIGLALQQTLGNLLAGLALAWEQRLSIGTWVEIDGEVGLIEQTGWRSLIARTRLGERVLIPNSDVAAARLTILGSGERPVAVPVRLGVAYGVPPDAVKEVFRGVAADMPGVFADPAPRILTKEFADSAVVYECRLWTQTPWARDDMTDEFLTRAHAALARAGMEIPFPQRTFHRPRPQQPIDTVDRRREALDSCTLFADLADEAIDLLAAATRLRRWAPSEAVVRSGDESTALHVVATGTAIVERNSRVIATLQAGDYFGETALLSSSPRTATVRAAGGPLEVVEINADSLQPVLTDHPELADQLAEKMASRQLEGEEFRDESGALVSPAGLVAQFRNHLLKIIGR